VSRSLKLRGLVSLGVGGFFAIAAAQTQTPATPPAANSADDLFQLGQQLFNDLAPPEIKAQFAFPTREQWDEFWTRLQTALDGESLDGLASYASEARTALIALRAVPGYEDLADWLEQRLDEIEGAQESLKPAPSPTPSPKAPVPSPRPVPSPKVAPSVRPIPHYDLWLARVRQRPAPGKAFSLLPRVQSAFRAEGVPPELVWLAEAESTFNPSARSPAGAKGLFQFMPDTARSLGLDTFLPDERTDPEKSARAAARHLRTLHSHLGNWPLALAAYNAGEGRVRRAMTASKASDFFGVAGSLPAETRMYVPKVLALVETRTGVAPERIPAPQMR
jgi:membrane-bound lytic murein transglycosylase D